MNLLGPVVLQALPRVHTLLVVAMKEVSFESDVTKLFEARPEFGFKIRYVDSSNAVDSIRELSTNSVRYKS